MALFTDTFTGTDNTLVSTTTGWFIDAGFGTDVFRLDGSGNVKSGSYVEAGKAVLHDTGGASHYIEAVVGAGFVGNPGFFSLVVSSSSNVDTAISLFYNFGSLYIAVNGTSASISGGVPVAGDTLRLEYDATAGTALFKINGTTIASGSVSGVTSTQNAGLDIAYSGAGGIADVFRSVSIDALSGTQTLAPSLVTNNQTFYSPTVTNGTPLVLAPSLLTNTQTFYAPTVAQPGVTAAYVLANTGAVGANPQGFMYDIAGLVSSGDYMTYTTVSGPTPGGGTLVEYVDGRFEYTGGAPAIWVVQVKINGSNYFETTTVYLYDQEFTLLPPLLTNAQTFYAPTVARVVVPGTPGTAGDKNTPSGMIGFWNR